MHDMSPACFVPNESAGFVFGNVDSMGWVAGQVFNDYMV